MTDTDLMPIAIHRSLSNEKNIHAYRYGTDAEKAVVNRKLLTDVYGFTLNRLRTILGDNVLTAEPEARNVTLIRHKLDTRNNEHKTKDYTEVLSTQPAEVTACLSAFNALNQFFRTPTAGKEIPELARFASTTGFDDAVQYNRWIGYPSTNKQNIWAILPAAELLALPKLSGSVTEMAETLVASMDDAAVETHIKTVIDELRWTNSLSEDNVAPDSVLLAIKIHHGLPIVQWHSAVANRESLQVAQFCFDHNIKHAPQEYKEKIKELLEDEKRKLITRRDIAKEHFKVLETLRTATPEAFAEAVSVYAEFGFTMPEVSDLGHSVTVAKIYLDGAEEDIVKLEATMSEVETSLPDFGLLSIIHPTGHPLGYLLAKGNTDMLVVPIEEVVI